MRLSISTSLIAISLPVFIIIYSRKKTDGNNVLITFILTMFVSLIGFSLIGWFPTWIMLALGVLGGFAFIRMGGMGGK